MSTPVRFDLSRHVSLSASAGSGKTYALTHRLLRMLSGGVNPEQILCTTFTNKATNEMAERLMRTLNRLAGEEPFKGFSSDEAREISELLTGETSLGSGTTDRVRAVAREARKRLLAGYSRLNISTMDSFFNMVLRLFPFEAGVPPDFSIMNEAEEQETFRSSLNRLVAEVLADESDAGLLESLLRSLSQTETNPESMLGRFFSDFLPHRVNISRYMKTAMQGAMTRDTVEALRKEESDTAREVVEACHAFVAALAPHAEALSPSARRAFARCRAAASPMDVTALTPFAGDHYRDYLYFKKAPEDDRIVAAFDRTRQVLRRHVQAKSRFAVGALLYFFQRYLSHADRIKRRDRKLSFSDVERLCFELMVGYGDNDPDFLAGAHDYFYYRIDARVKHLLMDEFQDTNILQWEIFRPIILEITADHEGSFFYVGDPKQAIYRFRGGESRLFYHVREELKNRGIEPDELPVNYRSAQSIVSFVNTVFRYISRTERYDFSPQAGFRKDAGYVEMATVPRGDKESPHSPLYEALSRRIATCHSSGFRYRDMAVLLLDNKTCTEVAEYLEQRGIPAATDKKSSLFDSASIRSVMALLHYLSDPTDDLHLMEFLSQLMKNRPAPERINLLETQPARRMEALALHMGSAHRLLSHLRDIADLVSIRELVVRIIRGFSLGRVFNDPGNLVKLVELAGAFPEAHGASGLRSFLSAVERYGRAVPMAPESEPDAVQVLTVHKSKGLEYRAVFLPQTDESFTFSKQKSNFMMPLGDRFQLNAIHLTPSKNELPFAGSLAEVYRQEQEAFRMDALNLLYVALTRAMDALFILGVPEPVARKDTEHKARSWFSVLCEAIEVQHGTGTVDTVLHASGSGIEPGNDGREAGEAPIAASETGERVSPVGRDQETESGPPDSRPDQTIPSQASSDERPDERHGRENAFSVERVQARIYGEAFHFAVERYAFERSLEGSVAAAVQRYGAVLGGPGTARLRADLEALEENPRTRDWLSSKDILPELPLALADGSRRKADAVMFAKEGITVLDYKTMFNAEFLPEYRQQLAQYMGLVKEAFPGQAVQGSLVFVEGGRVKFEDVPADHQ